MVIIKLTNFFPFTVFVGVHEEWNEEDAHIIPKYEEIC